MKKLKATTSHEKGFDIMNKLIFDRGNFSDFTSVSNIFIDEYMPGANGEFIKIYLHLLRLVNTGCEDLSISKIADKFNMLETDVIRALNYWSDQHLLSLSFDDSYNITGVRLESLSHNRYIVKGISGNRKDEDTIPETLATASGEVSPMAVPESTGVIVPARKKYNSKDIAVFSKDERLSQLTFLAETYLGKTLTSSDVNCIIYMLHELNLAADFIEYILETSISNGHKTLSYVEKQAVNYFKKNILTIEEAKADARLRSEICKSIYKIFGLEAKTPAIKELDYISKWTSELGFSDKIILEACNRTMEHTHTASFQYADKILLTWSGNKVSSMDDIKKLDSAHSEENKEKYKKPKAVSRPKNAKQFASRGYNHVEIEKQARAKAAEKAKLVSQQ